MKHHRPMTSVEDVSGENWDSDVLVKLHETPSQGADLRRADLSNADLSHCDLRNADLSEAILDHTDLTQADLRGAQFDSAKLNQTRLNGAIFDSTTRMPLEKDDAINAGMLFLEPDGEPENYES